MRRRWNTGCPTSAWRCASGRPTSRRSITASTACWCAGPWACCKPSAGRAHRRPVLRPGQFHAADCRLGRARWSASKAAKALVDRARANAELNGLAERCEFQVANLFEATAESLAALGKLDKLLIDPPREGAVAVVKALGRVGSARGSSMFPAIRRPWRAMPAVLVHEKGYALRGAGIASMFPHTSHVESIACSSAPRTKTAPADGARGVPPRLTFALSRAGR